VSKDRRNGARVAGRLGSPGGGIKMLDKHLIQAVIGGKGLDRASAELRVNLALTRRHCLLLLDL
jgi:hypothetical protein